MKRAILKLANSLLRPYQQQIVKITPDPFTMTCAVERIRDHGIPIATVIDIGASDGTWSVNAIPFFPSASFLAIEPLQERMAALEDRKHVFANFDYALCVAGDSDATEVTLNVSRDLDGSTVDGSGGESRQVPVRTIDSLVSERNLQGPFLLKFDTHGYEIPILAGARNTLKKINAVIMEVYNFKITEHALRFHEMCFHMEGLGFRCFDLADPMLRLYDRSFWQMDLFFCREDSAIFSHSQYR